MHPGARRQRPLPRACLHPPGGARTPARRLISWGPPAIRPTRAHPQAHCSTEAPANTARRLGRGSMTSPATSLSCPFPTCAPGRPSKILLVQVWTLSASPIPRLGCLFLSFFFSRSSLLCPRGTHRRCGQAGASRTRSAPRGNARREPHLRSGASQTELRLESCACGSFIQVTKREERARRERVDGDGWMEEDAAPAVSRSHSLTQPCDSCQMLVRQPDSCPTHEPGCTPVGSLTHTHTPARPTVLPSFRTLDPVVARVAVYVVMES